MSKTQKTPAQDLKVALKHYDGGPEMANKRTGKVGSSFDSFLAEQGILEECEEQAIKQILADQIKSAMEKARPPKLDGDNVFVMLSTEAYHRNRPDAIVGLTPSRAPRDPVS